MADHSALQIGLRRQGRAVVISPKGDVDLTGSPALGVELRRAMSEAGVKVVVDLSGVPYMDSSGLATLIAAMLAAKKSHGEFAVCGLSERVRTIVQLAKLDRILPIVASLEDAVK
ncbi:MAG: STAS domain-containing protein [Planctomycetaceae bacterium]|jgi:anti-sigma B factor antagonist|nr:STAS domain-containing protein [Phycisphaerales bacterium]MCE2653497.1 STAS domain-containing protein [Planctomycetaceae bacterium]